MNEGPDITRIAALIGDPARANMLQALMSGKALTARELADEAQISPQTASSHLAKLSDNGLVSIRREGRHRYVSLGDAEVAAMLENLSGLASRKGHLRTVTGPRDAKMRACRVCYDHLAGDRAVRLYEAFAKANWFEGRPERPGLSTQAQTFIQAFGVDLSALEKSRRPLCRPCLDWSERRHHLAGALGASILQQVFAKGWAHRLEGSRTVVFTSGGEHQFEKWLKAIS